MIKLRDTLSSATFFWGSAIILIIAGVIIRIYGSSFDQYIDIQAGQALFSNPYVNGICAGGDWHQKMDEFRSLRYPLIDSGHSFVLLGLSLIMLRKLFYRSDQGWVSPQKKVHFFIIGLLIIAGLYFAIFMGLISDLQRQMLPHCADSISIPMFGLLFSVPIIVPIFLIAGVICTYFFGQIPVKLVNLDAYQIYNIKSWIVSIFFGIIIIFNLYSIIDIFSSVDNLMIVPLTFSTYLCLATRAAILSPKI